VLDRKVLSEAQPIEPIGPEKPDYVRQPANRRRRCEWLDGPDRRPYLL